MRIVFNFEDKEFNKNGKIIKLKAEVFKDILNLYALQTIYNGTDLKGYTIISSQKIKKVFSRYKPYIDYLRFNNYIERSNYIVGKKSYGYRLTEHFKKDISINKITYYPNNKKIKKKSNNYTIPVKEWVNARLKKDFNSCEIVFNLNQKQLEKTKDEWGNFIDIGKWFNNNVKLYKWTEKTTTRYYTWSSNRLYTNFTNLSSHIRLNNVMLNNEPIVEFDISNSFPLMLAKYCFIEKPDIANDYNFKEYCSSVINGSFYSKLQTKLNNIRNCNKKNTEDAKDIRKLSRSETKILFQQYLNGNNNKIAYLNGVPSLINDFFKVSNNLIHDIIIDLKNKGKNKLYKELVKLETNLIMSIVEELYTKYKDIKIITCHDAIYVPQSYKQKTQEIWDNKINNFIKNLPVEVEDDDSNTDNTSEFGVELFSEFTMPSKNKYHNNSTYDFDDDFWKDNDDFWDNI